jgi:membrane glycosyltransferase
VQSQALSLFIVMMSLLLLPKFLSLLIHLRSSYRSKAFGGGPRLVLSMLCETLGSTFLAPNLALLQARFVLGTLMGRNVEWNAQDRSEASTQFREALRRHWPSTLLGIVWTILLALTVPKLIWWFSPVILGFLLAVPLSAWSSRASWGAWAKNHGLFLTAEEIDPPDIVKRFQQELERLEAATWNLSTNGLNCVLRDENAWKVHLSLLPASPASKDPLRRNHLERLGLKVRHQGLDALAPQEKRELLLDGESLHCLRRQMVSS